MKKETISNIVKFAIAFLSALMGALSGSAAVVAMNASPILIA